MTTIQTIVAIPVLWIVFFVLMVVIDSATGDHLADALRDRGED